MKKGETFREKMITKMKVIRWNGEKRESSVTKHKEEEEKPFRDVADVLNGEREKLLLGFCRMRERERRRRSWTLSRMCGCGHM